MVSIFLFYNLKTVFTDNASVLVTNDLVTSRLDYCNLLFRSLSKSDLRKLQCIQNSAACIVTNTSRYHSITPAFRGLHWLPVEHCCVFKTVTLVYESLITGFHRYFTPFLHLKKLVQYQVQKAGGSLVVPNFPLSVHKSKYGFAFDTPTLWIGLPDDIQAAPSAATFRGMPQNIPLQQGIPFLVSFNMFYCLPQCVPFAMSLDMNVQLCFSLLCLREQICSLAAIKHCKHRIRILVCVTWQIHLIN